MYRSTSAAENAQATAVARMVEFEEERIGKRHLSMKSTDGKGRPKWNEFFSTPAVDVLTAGAGLYISEDQAKLHKAGSGAVKAGTALRKAFADKPPTGVYEALWFEMRTDERADMIAKSYYDAAAVQGSLGHRYEKKILENIGDWWDRLARTVVTVAMNASAGGAEQAREILDQRLTMFDVYMRDANQLARGITAMVVAEESSMAGKYLFPLLVKPGGPSAATLAGKVHELTKQMTKVEETAKSGVNRAADALTAAKAGKGAAAELAKATAAIAALQKELKTLKNTEQSTAATARKMKARVDALEAAKP